jgi:hypothetical protein
LQSRKAVSIIKEHQVIVLIFTGLDFSLGVTERAKRELCFYFRRRLEPAPSGGVAGYNKNICCFFSHCKCLYSQLPNCKFGRTRERGAAPRKDAAAGAALRLEKKHIFDAGFITF